MGKVESEDEVVDVLMFDVRWSRPKVLLVLVGVLLQCK